MPEVSVEAVHGMVAGRVQGVGFRWSTAREATRLGVVGWVRNLPDGRVEVLVQGDRKDVQAMRAYLESGPPGAWVASLDLRPVEPDETLTRFDIS